MDPGAGAPGFFVIYHIHLHGFLTIIHKPTGQYNCRANILSVFNCLIIIILNISALYLLTKISNMKKIATRFLLLLLMVSVSATTLTAASIPATEPVAASEPVSAPAATKAEPSPETVKSAVEEFNNQSKHEKKSRLKDVKKALKEYRKAKKEGKSDDDAKLILLVILAILLPPLAVFLKEEEFNYKTALALLLCLLAIISFVWWILPVLYALLVVFDVL
jgi:uncharacterized membrane protein YqaE (UPF0057 family)